MALVPLASLYCFLSIENDVCTSMLRAAISRILLFYFQLWKVIADEPLGRGRSEVQRKPDIPELISEISDELI